MKRVFRVDGYDFLNQYYLYNKDLEIKWDYNRKPYVCCPQCGGKVTIDESNKNSGKCDCGCNVTEKDKMNSLLHTCIA